MPRSVHRFALGLTCLGLAATSLQAADFAADLRIDRVTVYLSGAMVTRSGTVTLPAGSQRLVVRGLPAGINRNLVTVRMESSGVQLGAVDVVTVNEGDYVSPRERELRARLEQLTDQRAVIQDEMDTAQTQIKLLESLAANPAGGTAGGSTATSGTGLSTLLASVGTNAAAARTRLREARLRQRGVDSDIETARAELAKVATARKASTELRVAVESTGTASVPVSVSYRVEDAGWDWIYQARLDTTAGRIDLLRQGRVRQRSGEDWSDVALTLTTAVPEANASTPTLNAQFLDLQDRQPVMVAPPAPRVLGAMRPQAQAAEIVEMPQAIVALRPRATAFTVDYDVPGRTSLAADNQERLLPVASEQFGAAVVARVLPAVSRRAWLEATFRYEQDTPIEAGTLQLYRDGAYVGEAPTAAILPGADVCMPFGTDERIRVAVRDEAAKSDQTAGLGRQAVQETRQRFEITSYHATPINVQVLDRVPVSRNNDVRVEVLKGATEPTRKDVDGKAGVYAWEFSAQPQKTMTLRQYYAVRYPRDRVLTRSEEGD